MTFFECYADETLLKFLGFTSKELAGGHSFGRSKVSGRLMKSQKSLGLVDEDPGSARDNYLNYLFKLKPKYKDGNVLIFEDKKPGNRLIVVRPNLESCVVKLAKEVGLSLAAAKYGLSMEPKRLHEVLTPKGNTTARNKLIEFMKDASKHPSIIRMKQLIKV